MTVLEYFIDILKKNNIAITTSRLTILEVLVDAKEHLDVDQILEKVRKKDNKIGLATLYRTLNIFCDSLIIIKHDFEGEKTLYEKSDIHPDHHHHIIDSKNRKIIEFPCEEIDKILSKICNDYGYKMLSHKVEVYGEKK